MIKHPPISTKRRTTAPLTTNNWTHMELDIQVVAWERHVNVAD